MTRPVTNARNPTKKKKIKNNLVVWDERDIEEYDKRITFRGMKSLEFGNLA